MTEEHEEDYLIVEGSDPLEDLEDSIVHHQMMEVADMVTGTITGGTDILMDTTLQMFLSSLYAITETKEESKLLDKLMEVVSKKRSLKAATVREVVEMMEDITKPGVIADNKLDRALTRCLLQAVVHTV